MHLRCFELRRSCSMSFNLSLKCLRIFLELSSIGLRLSLDEEKENPCPVFLFSMKREIRSNYAVSRRSRATTEKKIYKTRNARCCFANKTYCFFVVLVAVAVVVS